MHECLIQKLDMAVDAAQFPNGLKPKPMPKAKPKVKAKVSLAKVKDHALVEWHVVEPDTVEGQAPLPNPAT